MTPGEEALAAIPREPFIPETIYVPSDDTGWLVPLQRTEHPDRWRARVRENNPVVTAVAVDPRAPRDLLDPAAGRGYVSTSSSSDPRIMARMIDVLDLEPGMRVLEIGTGTGYNAALLAHLTGAENVISVEVAPDLAEHAKAALEAAGYPVRVVTGDGNGGYPPGAPYDRVIATAAVRTLPYAWVEQTRPGGRILTPWAPVFHPEGPLGVLTVGADGAAEGRFVEPAPFMPMRDQRVDLQEAHGVREWWESEGKPDWSRFGVTVNAEGQSIWVDDSANTVM